MTWAAEIADAQAGIRDGFRKQQAILIKQGGTSGSAHNPTRGAGTEYTCYIGETKISQYERANELVQMTDRRFMVSTEGLTVAPEVSDSLRVGSDTLAIVAVEPFQPGGEVIYWKVRVNGE